MKTTRKLHELGAPQLFRGVPATEQQDQRLLGRARELLLDQRAQRRDAGTGSH